MTLSWWLVVGVGVDVSPCLCVVCARAVLVIIVNGRTYFNYN